jgi:glycosyltransferase involved in cell wall biosynthesis
MVTMRAKPSGTAGAFTVAQERAPGGASLAAALGAVGRRSGMSMDGRLAYLVSRFPLLSETFILREMLQMEARGWPLELFALQHEHPAVRHPQAERLERSANFHELVSGRTVRANARQLVCDPVRYGRLLARTVLGNLGSADFLAKGLAIFPGVVELAARMRRRGVRHIHAHYGTHPALAAMLSAELIGAGYSFTVHAHDLFVDTTMLAEKVHRARFVATISEFNRRRLIELAGPVAAEKVVVVRCGVDPRRYAFSPRTPHDGPWRILAVASLQEYKGLEYLVRACARLRDEGTDLPFFCEIAGGGPLHDSLQHLIARLGVGDRVRLLGPQDENGVRALMERADTLVMPSVVARDGQMEGIPVVLMEAMALGLPVVASHLSGIPELVRHQETGLLVQPGDPEAIKDAILACWRGPDAAAGRASAARLLVEQEYDLERNVAQLAAQFERAVDAPASPVREPAVPVA